MCKATKTNLLLRLVCCGVDHEILGDAMAYKTQMRLIKEMRQGKTVIIIEKGDSIFTITYSLKIQQLFNLKDHVDWGEERGHD